MTRAEQQRGRERDLRRGVGALAALLLLAIGVPCVLVSTSVALLGSPNPVAGVAPWRASPESLRRLFTSAVEDRALVDGIARTALVIGWAALAIVLVSVVAELWMLWRHGVTGPRVRGFGWSQHLARRIASGLLALSTFVPAHVATAAPLSARVPAVERVIVPLPAALSPSSSPAAPVRPLDLGGVPRGAR